MRKLLLIAAVVSMVGCDGQVDAPPQRPTIASMIANGTEERVSECEKGSVSLKCEYLSGDLLGSGKWHHAIVHISKSGDVSLSIDNLSYYQLDARSGFVNGEKFGHFDFSGPSKSKARVSISNSNDGSRISLDAWDANENKFMAASN